MKLKAIPGSHITYCTNIHPGESWADLYANLQIFLPNVKQQTSPNEPMGVGLRLSADASRELTNHPPLLIDFKQWLDEQGLYVFTINGFPFGTFHNEAVKEKVYEPDWSNIKRLTYTKELANILATLLPENVTGSISTVPLGFKENFSSGEKVEAAVQNLEHFALYAEHIKQSSNKTIQLALEPEPSCYLETLEDVLNFFNNTLYTATKNSPTLKQHVGLCLDTCHSAVMFEDPWDFYSTAMAQGIPVYKIQLTTALKVPRWTASHREILEPYAEPTYLHQTCVKCSKTNRIQFFLDLPEALAHVKDGDELRSHFHVPVFAKELQNLNTTQDELIHLLENLNNTQRDLHLEVETYTFNVLPESLTLGSVADNISREIAWTVGQIK